MFLKKCHKCTNKIIYQFNSTYVISRYFRNTIFHVNKRKYNKQMSFKIKEEASSRHLHE